MNRRSLLALMAALFGVKAKPALPPPLRIADLEKAYHEAWFGRLGPSPIPYWQAQPLFVLMDLSKPLPSKNRP